MGNGIELKSYRLWMGSIFVYGFYLLPLAYRLEPLLVCSPLHESEISHF